MENVDRNLIMDLNKKTISVCEIKKFLSGFSMFQKFFP